MHNSFCIALCDESMPAFDKSMTEVAIIVNLPIVHDPGPGRLLGHRLVPCLEIDDAESIVREDTLVESLDRVRIRAAVPEGFIHSADEGDVDALVRIVNAADSAHL